jgi:hypothetical protein
MSMNLEPSDDQQASPSALLVYAQFEPLHALRVALASQEIDTWRARSCRQALSFLAKFRPVHVIFTDMNLPDGTWLDLVHAKLRTPAPVIVVARKMDASLWSEIIQRGAGLILQDRQGDFRGCVRPEKKPQKEVGFYEGIHNPLMCVGHGRTGTGVRRNQRSQAVAEGN